MKNIKLLNLAVLISAAFLNSMAFIKPEIFSKSQIISLVTVQLMALIFLVDSQKIKKLIWPLGIVLLAFSQLSQAQFVMRIDVDKEAIRFNDKKLNNEGIHTDDRASTCLVNDADLAKFGGRITRVSEFENAKCFLEYEVPESEFSLKCNPNFNDKMQEFIDYMNTRGVDMFGPLYTFGSC